jgi:hypothetical protein
MAAVGLTAVFGLTAQTVLAVPTAAPPTPSTELSFMLFDAGCRLSDTRSAVPSGIFGQGAVKTYSATDPNLTAQGGASLGCNVPLEAAAIEVSISTAAGSPTATGYLRAGPGPNQIAPQSTVLQFLKGQATSVTTPVALDEDGDFNIQVNGAKAHVVVDVIGYWAPVHSL